MRKSPLSRFPAKAGACAILGAVSLAAAEASSPDEARVLIRYRQAPSAVHQEQLKAHGASVQRSFKLVPALAATVPTAALAGIRKLPDVEVIEPDLEVHALGEIDATWGLVRIGCGPVLAGTYSGAVGPVLGTGVRVAVVDTGIDYLHPDLMGNYAGGYDFVNNDTDPMDDHGHGTHVSGTIAAVRNGVGVLGAAPETDLYALKALGAGGGRQLERDTERSGLVRHQWDLGGQFQSGQLELSRDHGGNRLRQCIQSGGSAGGSSWKLRAGS